MRVRLVFASGSAGNIDRIGTTFELVECGRNVLGAPYLENTGIKAERTGRRLSVAHLLHHDAVAAIAHNCQALESGKHFAQELDTLAGKLGCLDGQAGDVAAGPRQTFDETAADRVSSRREYNRDDRGRLLRDGGKRGR